MEAENEYGNMEKSFGISADHTSLAGCPHPTATPQSPAKSKVKYSINILNLHNLRKFQLVKHFNFSTSRIRVGVLSLVQPSGVLIKQSKSKGNPFSVHTIICILIKPFSQKKTQQRTTNNELASPKAKRSNTNAASIN